MKKLYYLAGLMVAATACTTALKTTVSIHMEGERVNEIPITLNTKDSIYSVRLCNLTIRPYAFTFIHRAWKKL